MLSLTFQKSDVRQHVRTSPTGKLVTVREHQRLKQLAGEHAEQARQFQETAKHHTMMANGSYGPPTDMSPREHRDLAASYRRQYSNSLYQAQDLLAQANHLDRQLLIHPPIITDMGASLPMTDPESGEEIGRLHRYGVWAWDEGKKANQVIDTSDDLTALQEKHGIPNGQVRKMNTMGKAVEEDFMTTCKLTFGKAHIKRHSRISSTGKVGQVREHEDKRTPADDVQRGHADQMVWDLMDGSLPDRIEAAVRRCQAGDLSNREAHRVVTDAVQWILSGEAPDKGRLPPGETRSDKFKAAVFREAVRLGNAVASWKAQVERRFTGKVVDRIVLDAVDQAFGHAEDTLSNEKPGMDKGLALTFGKARVKRHTRTRKSGKVEIVKEHARKDPASGLPWKKKSKDGKEDLYLVYNQDGKPIYVTLPPRETPEEHADSTRALDEDHARQDANAADRQAHGVVINQNYGGAGDVEFQRLRSDVLKELMAMKETGMRVPPGAFRHAAMDDMTEYIDSPASVGDVADTMIELADAEETPKTMHRGAMRTPAEIAELEALRRKAFPDLPEYNQPKPVHPLDQAAGSVVTSKPKTEDSVGTASVAQFLRNAGRTVTDITLADELDDEDGSIELSNGFDVQVGADYFMIYKRHADPEANPPEGGWSGTLYDSHLEINSKNLADLLAGLKKVEREAGLSKGLTLTFGKAHVKQHSRTEKTGKVSQVKEHEDKRKAVVANRKKEQAGGANGGKAVGGVKPKKADDPPYDKKRSDAAAKDMVRPPVRQSEKRKMKEDAASQNSEEVQKFGEEIGFDPEWFGEQYTDGVGMEFTVVGLNPDNREHPVIVRDSTGKKFVTTVDSVKKRMKNPDGQAVKQQAEEKPITMVLQRLTKIEQALAKLGGKAGDKLRKSVRLMFGQ